MYIYIVPIVVFSAAQFHMRCLFCCEIFISTHFPFLIDYSHEFGDMNKYVNVWDQPMNIDQPHPVVLIVSCNEFLNIIYHTYK